MTEASRSDAAERWRPGWAVGLAAVCISGGLLVLWWGIDGIVSDRPGQWMSGLGTVVGTGAIVLAVPPLACLVTYLVRGPRVWFWSGIGLVAAVAVFVASLVLGDPMFW